MGGFFLDQNHALLDGAQDIFIKLTAEVPNDVQVIYGDHETRIGDQLFPEFKTALDIEMLMARDYITQVCAIRASNLSKWPENRVDLYEIIFNLALNNGARAFYHTPEVMATLDGSTVPEHVAIETLSRQLVIHARLGDSVRLQAHKGLMGCLVVKRNWQAVSQEAPQVSIIIPTLGRGRLIQPCVNTIIQHTAYPNYEIIVVLNGGQLETAELGEAADDPRVRSVTWSHKDGFNWSSLNNEIAKKHAKGDFLLFMNDDVTVSSLDRDWLDLMMGHAVQPTVGAVGAKLIHPVGVLQHIGVVAHKGIAGHSAKGLPVGHPGANGIGLLTHEVSAVTGACMLVERKKFDEVGGFDENFDLNYNDTDFCLRLRQIGYRNVVEIHAELLHPEGVTRDSPMTAKGAEKLIADNIKFMAKWQEPDPYWNVNLALTMMRAVL